MSARYSNTSSRGREIVVETVIGSTGGDSMRRRRSACPPTRSGGPAVGDPHRVPERRTVDGPRAHGLIALERAAQLAKHDLALVEVDLLADQRRPVAPSAGLQVRHAIVNAPAQKRQLEVSDHPY